MKLSTAFLVAITASTTSAFAPSSFGVRKTTSLAIGKESNVDLGGNAWKPDSEKMGATDTGDYFPEGYDRSAEPAFQTGMMGSQNTGGGDRGPQLPGMENLGADAVIQGGIELSEDIPEGMEFIPSSVPDGTVEMNVAATSGAEYELAVAPVCMTFEDYFAAFAPGSHPSFSVEPATGRMDRRGGEPSFMTIRCVPEGRAGQLEGDLVINLPEDNSKICYKVIATSF
uniref:Uncharacterized protein n=1 Tax=Ditylum brightwellii TaxID=49249 RepID=A0A7S1ZF96_9STRA|mmetsp:Transcript_3072/g.4672  ORF Transcript_3072/g.4672 Transcript_3072/m.4672 type:complete len:227 (+) Transcript_3072:50-730(+)